MDQLNHIIDTTFSSVGKFEPLDRYTTLQSLYTALDHQLQGGLMGQQEFDRTQFIVRKLWDLKLQPLSLGMVCLHNRCLSTCVRICIQDDVAVES